MKPAQWAFIAAMLLSLSGIARGEERPPPPTEPAASGKLQIVRGARGSVPQLRDPAGKPLLLVGEWSEELTRLGGHEVKVWGRPGEPSLGTPTLAVMRYEIVDSGGGRPVVGHVQRDPTGALMLVPLPGEAAVTPLTVRAGKGFLQKLGKRAACKVWILGTVEAQAIKATSFGYLSCKPAAPPPEPDAPGSRKNEPSGASGDPNCKCGKKGQNNQMNGKESKQ